MTKQIDSDDRSSETGCLPFPAAQMDRLGLRVTRSEFARLMGASKQAVSEWVKSGKITLGSDGRLDPREAVSQLLRNSDPAKVRARVLAPLTRELGSLQERINELEAAVVRAREDAVFAEGSCGELIEVWETLRRQLFAEREVLAAMPAGQVIDAILNWMTRITEGALHPGQITDHVIEPDSLLAPCDPEKGEGDQHSIVSTEEEFT